MRLFVSTTAIRTILRLKQVKAKDRFLSRTVSCGRTPAAPGNSAAGWVYRRRSGYARRAVFSPLWSGPSALPGGYTVAKTHWRTASASCAKTVRHKGYRRAKLLDTWRSKPAMGFWLKWVGAEDFGNPWNATLSV